MLAGIAVSGYKVVLTGFMGAGKTTVGRLLADALGVSFDDLDTLVCAEHGMDVRQIFTNRGEDIFREAETRCLEAWLTRSRSGAAVLALGGGAVETIRVRELLTSVETTVFHLDAPLPVLLQRCSGTHPERPLLIEAEERYARRANIYRQTGITIATDGKTPEEVTAAILRFLKDGR